MVSVGSSKTSGGSSSEGLYPWAQPFAQELMRSYQSFLGGGGLDPAKELYGKAISGGYLDSGTGPLAEQLKAIKEQYAGNLGTALRGVRSQTGLKGVDTGSAGEQILGQTATDIARGANQAATEAIMSNYQREREAQMQAPQYLMALLSGAFSPLSQLRQSASTGGSSSGFNFGIAGPKGY